MLFTALSAIGNEFIIESLIGVIPFILTGGKQFLVGRCLPRSPNSKHHRWTDIFGESLSRPITFIQRLTTSIINRNNFHLESR